jgi:hypothetical protein
MSKVISLYGPEGEVASKTFDRAGTVDAIHGKLLEARVACDDTGPKSFRLIVDLKMVADEKDYTLAELQEFAKEEFISIFYKAVSHFGDWITYTGRDV